jgi:outer membrane protein assembly factor BamB
MEIGGWKIDLFGGDCMPALNESDGSQAWVFTPAAQAVTFFDQPVYVRGVLYATNGLSYAIDTETGKQLAQARRETAGTFLSVPRYGARSNDVLVWSGLNLYAYKPLK